MASCLTLRPLTPLGYSFLPISDYTLNLVAAMDTGKVLTLHPAPCHRHCQAQHDPLSPSGHRQELRTMYIATFGPYFIHEPGQLSDKRTVFVEEWERFKGTLV
jgi:hypothetical protein